MLKLHSSKLAAKKGAGKQEGLHKCVITINHRIVKNVESTSHVAWTQKWM